MDKSSATHWKSFSCETLFRAVFFNLSMIMAPYKTKKILRNHYPAKNDKLRDPQQLKIIEMLYIQYFVEP